MNISGILFSGANGVYSTKLVTGNNTLDRENPDILRDVGLYQFNLEVRNTSVLRGTVLTGVSSSVRSVVEQRCRFLQRFCLSALHNNLTMKHRLMFFFWLAVTE